jgi:hypothetical protein
LQHAAAGFGTGAQIGLEAAAEAHRLTRLGRREAVQRIAAAGSRGLEGQQHQQGPKARQQE